MRAEARFTRLPKEFWAHVRTLSQHIGYTERGGQIKVPNTSEMVQAFSELELRPKLVLDERGDPTELGQHLLGYFAHRAAVLNEYVEPRLMNKQRARSEFERLRKGFKPACPLPMNKQRGKKKAPAYLTGIVNMLIDHHSGGHACDYDPRVLTSVTRDGILVRTLARRVDGAFPGALNPVAIWEIKEYYNTTTFGSRVADGVYESLLDGMELEELREHEGIDVKHYLFVDDRYTWWDCGRSYLCRIVDMLHMGYLDEALFGYEVVERLPALVKSWLDLVAQRRAAVAGRPPNPEDAGNGGRAG